MAKRKKGGNALLSFGFFCSKNRTGNDSMFTMRILSTVLVTFFISLCALPGSSLAANFTVSPVKIFFDAGQKTSVLTITNNAAQPLTLQVTAVGWSQGDEGRDVYSPTRDIIVFPGIFTVERGQKRILRIGMRVPPAANERTYRIYMEEVRPSHGEELKGSALTTLMKVGVPVFMSPFKASPEAAIEKVGIANSIFSFSVANRGNVHYIVRNVKVEGFDKEGNHILGRDFTGWYILAGRAKKFSGEIPYEVCMKMVTLKIEVATDVLSMRESLSVLPKMCSH
jgi:fimbrial chaperone protein